MATQRSYMKCGQCRREHKKCLPRIPNQPRDWNGQREKCERCERLGHECGPPERKTSASYTNSENSEGGRQATEVQASPFDLNDHLSDATATPSSRPMESRGGHRDSAHVVDAATLVSIQNVVVSYLIAINKQVSWPARTSKARTVELLTELTEKIRCEFERAVQLAYDAIKDLGAVERQLTCWKLRSLNMQHYLLYFVKRKFNVASIRGTDETDFGMQPLPLDDKEACILLCTANVPRRIHDGARSASGQPGLGSETYQDIEQRTEILFRKYRKSLSNGSGDGPQLPDRFPASHLAYLNSDADVAFELWKKSPCRELDVDFLGRTFADLIRAARDEAMNLRLIASGPPPMTDPDPQWFGRLFHPALQVWPLESNNLFDGNGNCMESSSRQQLDDELPSPQHVAHRAKVNNYTNVGNGIENGLQDDLMDDVAMDVNSISCEDMVSLAEGMAHGRMAYENARPVTTDPGFINPAMLQRPAMSAPRQAPSYHGSDMVFPPSQFSGYAPMADARNWSDPRVSSFPQ